MKIGVLGTGMVGNAIGTKLATLGHEVRMGSRTAGNEQARAWAESAGAGASAGTFADAASFGELVFACIAGVHMLEALEAAGGENLAGKVVVQVGNPLDFSGGMPPTLAVCNTDSLGEQVQRTFPEARVVKTLDTMSSTVMVEPATVPGEHNVFVCGQDAGAKQQVTGLLESFGWARGQIVDLGGIEAARAVEMYVPLWLSLYGALGTGSFNIGIMR